MEKLNLLGIPFDANSSYMRGPALAPDKIREALHSPSSNYFNEAGRDVSALIHDRGDLPALIPYREMAAGLSKIYTPKEKWLFLGGDHSISFPTVTAVSAHFSELSILHFDAHSDLYDELNNNRFSHACPFARIMETGKIKRLVQLGIRTLNKHQQEQAEKFGVEIIPMSKWTDDLQIELTGPVYISLDLDVLDPAFVPGISHYEPGGISTRQLIAFLQRHKHLQVVAADLVEYNPRRDYRDMTAFVAAKLVKEMVSVMCS